MAVYRFRKPMEEAIKDYLAGIERDYNKSVIIENLRINDIGSIETEKHKITVCYCAGNKIRLIIKEKGGNVK